MNSKRKAGDVFWVILIWMFSLGLLLLVLLKLKIFYF